MSELRLEGCTAEPLAGYLKSIGLLRIIAAQADPGVRARWSGDTFVVDTTMSLADLIDFVVTRYVPTPIITPWNGGSGFGRDDATKSKTAFEAVAMLRASRDPRLATYRSTIDAAFRLTAQDGWNDLDKVEQVSLCRGTLPDEAVDWIDAAVVITTNSRSFPPLLGTGGNDGRLDFGSNFMQRVGDVLGVATKVRPAAELAALVRDALTGSSAGRLDLAAIGQFDPAAAGGPGSSGSGSADSLANPWDFMLLFEGAIAFASGVSRRFGASSSRSAMPFMVEGVAAAYGSAASENSRGEFWAPLWRTKATAGEVLRLVAEGRAEYKGHQARNAVDVSRALASLGVDRGIDEFVRYGFLERNGLSTFCVPVGRLRVRERQRVGVLGDLDWWINQVRWASPLPAAASQLLRAIDGHNVRISQTDGPAELQELLFDVSQLERLVGRSRALREKAPRLESLKASDWVSLLDDGTPEFEIAVALASFRRPGERTGWLRRLLTDERWEGRAPAVVGFGQRPLNVVLTDCLAQVSMRSEAPEAGDPRGSWCGPCEATWASSRAFFQFSTGQCDSDRVFRLLSGLLLLDWRFSSWTPPTRGTSISLNRIPTPIAALKPVFHHRGLGSLLPSRRPLRADRSVARLLQTGHLDRAIDSALRTIRIAGCPPITTRAGLAGRIATSDVAAALLVPVSDATARRLLNRVAESGDITKKEVSE